MTPKQKLAYQRRYACIWIREGIPSGGGYHYLVAHIQRDYKDMSVSEKIFWAKESPQVSFNVVSMSGSYSPQRIRFRKFLQRHEPEFFSKIEMFL